MDEEAVPTTETIQPGGEDKDQELVTKRREQEIHERRSVVVLAAFASKKEPSYAKGGCSKRRRESFPR